MSDNPNSEKLLTLNDNGGWFRDFEAEQLPLSDRIRALLAATYPRPTIIAGERQAQFFDTNFYFRLGGLVPEKVQRNADMLIIQAGIGSRMAETLPEHVQIAKDTGKRYATYLIPDVDDSLSMAEQVDNWFTWPGVADAPMVSDIEKPRPTTRHVNTSEFKTFQLRMKAVSDFLTWSYSRVNIFEVLFPSGFPYWMEDVLQWIAQYFLTPKGEYYKYFEDWLAVFAWQYPRAVNQSFLYQDPYWKKLVKAWQISPKFDGEYYLAPKYIEPGVPGIKSVDGNVSMEAQAVFLNYFPEPEPIPEPEPEPILCGDRFITVYDNQNFRSEPSTAGGNATIITKLPLGSIIAATPDQETGKDWSGISTYIPGLSNPKEIWIHGLANDLIEGWFAAAHPTISTVTLESLEPDTGGGGEEEETKMVRVKEDVVKVPAFSYKNKNEHGLPIMIINVYDKTKDPELLWTTNQEIKVVSKAIVADGNTKWYIVREDINKHGYPELYVRKDRVILVE